MRKLVLSAAALLFCAGMLRAQDEQPVNPEMQRQELVNLELENARAIKLHNPTFFKAAYSEDFHGVTRFGETVNKQGIIHELETMNMQFDSVVSSDAQVRSMPEIRNGRRLPRGARNRSDKAPATGVMISETMAPTAAMVPAMPAFAGLSGPTMAAI